MRILQSGGKEKDSTEVDAERPSTDEVIQRAVSYLIYEAESRDSA